MTSMVRQSTKLINMSIEKKEDKFHWLKKIKP
jgi:hypothetical protein